MQTINEDLHPEWKRQRVSLERLQEFKTVELQTNGAVRNYAIMKYWDLKEKLQQTTKELERVQKIEKEDDARIKDCKDQISSHKERQETMKKENILKFKDMIEAAEKELGVEKKILLTVEAKVNTAKLDVEDCQRNVKEAEKAKGVRVKEMADYKKKSANLVGEFEGVQREIEESEGVLEKAKEM